MAYYKSHSMTHDFHDFGAQEGRSIQYTISIRVNVKNDTILLTSCLHDSGRRKIHRSINIIIDAPKSINSYGRKWRQQNYTSEKYKENYKIIKEYIKQLKEKRKT